MRPPWAPTKPILVVGDYCTDLTIRASATRLSREQPVPVFLFDDAASEAGCAGNVVRQLRAYGIDVIELRVARTTKARVMAGEPEREVMRLDWPWAVLPGALALKAMPELAALVYVDYRGLAGPAPRLAAQLEAMPCPKIVDARSSLTGWGGFDVLKMNVLDAGLLRTPAYRLPALANVRHLVLTAGRNGHVVIAADRYTSMESTAPGPLRNVSGAGDVFTAVLAAVIGGTIERGGELTFGLVQKAAQLAGAAAGQRVTRPGYNVAVPWEEVGK